jgi:microcompartment protein CcmK/EutM
MKFGIVKGRVVCSRITSPLEDVRFLVVEPVTGEHLAKRDGKGGGRELIVADMLGPRIGQMIGYVEGREGSNPWYPARAAVDAVSSLVVEDYVYEPKPENGKRKAESTD